MSIQTTKFVRKPFVIEAVEVTAENIEQVAKWCSGEVFTTGPKTVPEAEPGNLKYVKVKVQHPLNERQTRAFVRDWVLKAGSGFKVYTPKAFANSFERVDENTNEKTPAERVELV